MFESPLTRDVAIIVIIKIAIVLAAGFFVFGPKQRPTIDSQITQEHLLGK